MKTAISIPDNVFAAAERAAKRLGISRSEFFTLAARRMVNRAEGRRLTEKIDSVLAGVKGDKGLDEALVKMQAAALADERW